MLSRTTRATLISLPLLLALTMSACGGATDPEAGSTGPDGGSAAPTPTASDGSFPVTVDNCGIDVTLTERPERIVMVNSDSLSNLEALGAVDRIVGITTPPQEGLYDSQTYTLLAELPQLSTEQNATGGSVVSHESIVGQEPDLVIAPENSVDRAALADAGIALYSPTAFCADPPVEYTETATFDRVWQEVTAFGQMLGETEAAEAAIAEAKSTLEAAAQDRGSAVALYVSSGGTVLSPYGGPSMVTPVFAAAGLSNVFADASDRVFDAGIEAIIAEAPETIVLLSSAPDPDDTYTEFMSSPGVDGLAAVQEGRVVVLPFPYTDPPSLLSTRGPAELVELIEALQ
ncbi:MAG: ABC transporter substrate-binding protein [Beutenbergiaceae bacterium]